MVTNKMAPFVYMTKIIAYLVFLSITRGCSAVTFSTPDSRIPYSASHTVAGCDEDSGTIWLLGGYKYNYYASLTHVVGYDIATDEFTEYDSLPVALWVGLCLCLMMTYPTDHIWFVPITDMGQRARDDQQHHHFFSALLLVYGRIRYDHLTI